MTQCKVCSTLIVVNDEDEIAIKTAISQKQITYVALAEVLTNNGYPVSEASIRRHVKHLG